MITNDQPRINFPPVGIEQDHLLFDEEIQAKEQRAPTPVKREAAHPDEVVRFEQHYYQGGPAAGPQAADGKPATTDGYQDSQEQVQGATQKGDAEVNRDEDRDGDDDNPFQQENGANRHGDRHESTGHQALQHRGTPAENAVSQIHGDMINYFNPNHTGAVSTREERAIENPADFVNEVADKLLNQLLVSDPSKDDRREVRLIFNEEFLPGVEVHMERVHGTLEVRLTTTDPSKRQALEDQVGSLEKHLGEQLDEDIKVLLDEGTEDYDI